MYSCPHCRGQHTGHVTTIAGSCDSLPHSSHAHSCGSLLVHQSAQSCLPLHDAVGHIHLPTEGRQEDHNLHTMQVIHVNYCSLLPTLYQTVWVEQPNMMAYFQGQVFHNFQFTNSNLMAISILQDYKSLQKFLLV